MLGCLHIFYFTLYALPCQSHSCSLLPFSNTCSWFQMCILSPGLSSNIQLHIYFCLPDIFTCIFIKSASNTTLFKLNSQPYLQITSILINPTLGKLYTCRIPNLSRWCNCECSCTGHGYKQAFLTLCSPTPSMCKLAHESCKFYLYTTF